MTTYRPALALTCVALLGACAASTQKLAPETTSALKGQTLAVATRDRPPMVLSTPGKRMGLSAFGAVGAVVAQEAAAADGTAASSKYRLAAPSELLSASLAPAVASRYGMRQVAAVPVGPGELEERAASVNGRARYLLDIYTLNWTVSDVTAVRYEYSHWVRAQLIDTQQRKLVAQADCKTPPLVVNDKAPTYDELFANDAAVLKQQIKDATDKCATQLRQEMLAL